MGIINSKIGLIICNKLDSAFDRLYLLFSILLLTISILESCYCDCPAMACIKLEARHLQIEFQCFG